MNNPNGAPECFGQMWSEKAPECGGGYDPGFVGPNGGKVRPKCDFYDACKTRVLLKNANARPALIPPQALMRPGFSAAVPYQSQGYVPGRAVQVQQTPQQTQPYYPQMHVRPMELIPASYHMPSYLSEPEVRMDGETYWAPLGREIFRGLGKALGHSVAHFFDHVPFTKKG